MSEKEDKKAKVVSILKAVKPEKTAKKTIKKRTKTTMNITGDGNIQAGRDIHVKTEKIIHRPKVTVKTGDGVIDAKQKARLLDLRDQIVKVSAIVQKIPRTQSQIIGSLNKKMKVNSYHEIPVAAFPKAEKYLLQWLGRLNTTPTARKKSPTWRNGRITAIQARCKERNLNPWRKDYMLKTFGKDSMVYLSDDEIERLYRAVMGKKV